MKHKVEELVEDSFYIDHIQTWDEYTLDDEEESDSKLSDLFSLLIEKMQDARKKGWTGVYVSFESNMDPYDHMAGPVEVNVRGYRKATAEELEEQKSWIEREELSKRLGITPYEAGIVLKLRENKKLRKELEQ